MDHIITPRQESDRLPPPIVQFPAPYQLRIMRDILQSIRSNGIVPDHITIVLLPHSNGCSDINIRTLLYIDPSGEVSILTSLQRVSGITIKELQSLLKPQLYNIPYPEAAFCLNIGKPGNGFIEWLLIWGECERKVIEGISGKELSEHLTRGLLHRTFAFQSSGHSWRSHYPTVAQRFRKLAQEGKLTRREQEVLIRALKGRTLKVIADDLTISYETVRRYLQHIYEKTETHSLIQLISKYLIYEDEMDDR